MEEFLRVDVLGEWTQMAGEGPEVFLLWKERALQTRWMMGQLDSKSRTAVTLRLGLGDRPPLTLVEVGRGLKRFRRKGQRHLPISRERARQLVGIGLGKMRIRL